MAPLGDVRHDPCVPEIENVTRMVDVFHQHGDSSLSERRTLFPEALWEYVVVSKGFLFTYSKKQKSKKKTQ